MYAIDAIKLSGFNRSYHVLFKYCVPSIDLIYGVDSEIDRGA